MTTIMIGPNGDLSVSDFANLVELLGREVSADTLAKHMPENTEAIGRVEYALDTTLMEIERES